MLEFRRIACPYHRKNKINQKNFPMLRNKVWIPEALCVYINKNNNLIRINTFVSQIRTKWRLFESKNISISTAASIFKIYTFSPLKYWRARLVVINFHRAFDVLAIRNVERSKRVKPIKLLFTADGPVNVLAHRPIRHRLI